MERSVESLVAESPEEVRSRGGAPTSNVELVVLRPCLHLLWNKEGGILKSPDSPSTYFGW